MESKSIYANGIAVSFAKNDCCLTFNMLVPKSLEIGNREAVIADSVNVTMTWSYAKKLAEMLNCDVKRYEKTYGKISDIDEGGNDNESAKDAILP